MANKKAGTPIKRDYFNTVLPRLTTIADMVSKGYQVKDIADYLGISAATFYKWKQRYPDLSIIYADSKCKMVDRIRNSMFKESVGYEYDEITTREIKDIETGKITFVETKKTTKWCRPSVQAAIFLLCNWAPDEFKRQDIEQTLKTLEVIMSKEVKDVYSG